MEKTKEINDLTYYEGRFASLFSTLSSIFKVLPFPLCYCIIAGADFIFTCFLYYYYSLFVLLFGIIHFFIFFMSHSLPRIVLKITLLIAMEEQTRNVYLTSEMEIKSMSARVGVRRVLKPTSRWLPHKPSWLWSQRARTVLPTREKGYRPEETTFNGAPATLFHRLPYWAFNLQCPGIN